MIIKALRQLVAGIRAEGHESLHTPTDEDALFVLKFGDLTVGHLSLHKGSWGFQYSEEFRAQSEVQPLVAFPDPDKEYRSESLWSFFMARIPSLTQPRIKDTIEKEGLDETSDVELLTRFGKRTISNPFVLTPATKP